MKKNKHICKSLAFMICALLTAVYAYSCGSTQKSTKKDADQFTQRSQNTVDELPHRLITDYSDMMENDLVSWSWIKTGFRLDLCRSVTLHPLENYSTLNYAWAEDTLEKALREIFDQAASKTSGTIDIGINAAIVEMHAQAGIIKRFFPSIEDYPYIEIEIIVFEESTKTPLLKACHYRKGEDFKPLVYEIIDDLDTFFKKKL